MSDSISRQAILDRTVNRNSVWNKITDSEGKNLEDILNSIPSTENKGEWQHDGNHWKNRFICSVCGYKLFDEPTNYCPNCGAKMKGGE